MFSIFRIWRVKFGVAEGTPSNIEVTRGVGFRVYMPILLLHMSYSLNSLKVAMWGTVYGSFLGAIKGDTRILGYS